MKLRRDLSFSLTVFLLRFNYTSRCAHIYLLHTLYSCTYIMYTTFSVIFFLSLLFSTFDLVVPESNELFHVLSNPQRVPYVGTYHINIIYSRTGRFTNMHLSLCFFHFNNKFIQIMIFEIFK